MSSKFYHEGITPEERYELRSRAGKDIDDYNYKHQARHPSYAYDPLPDSFIDYSAACFYMEKAQEEEERAQHESPPRSATSIFNQPTASRASATAAMSPPARSVVAVSPPPLPFPPNQHSILPIDPTDPASSSTTPAEPNAASSKKRPNPKSKNKTTTPTSPHRCHICGTLLSACACAREWATSPRRWHRSKANSAHPPPSASPAQWSDGLHRSSGSGAAPPESGYQEFQWERVRGRKKERYERVTQAQELSSMPHERTEPVRFEWHRQMPPSPTGAVYADDRLDGTDEQQRGGASSETSLGFGTQRGGGYCKGVCDRLVPRQPCRRSTTADSWTPPPARSVQKPPLRRKRESVALPAGMVRPQLAPLEIPRGGWHPPGWPSPTWVREDQNHSSYSPRPIPYEQQEWSPCYCPFFPSSSMRNVYGIDSDDDEEGLEICTISCTSEEFDHAISQTFEVEVRKEEAATKKRITAQKSDILQGNSDSQKGDALHESNTLEANDTLLPKDTAQQRNPLKHSDALQEQGGPQENYVPQKQASDTPQETDTPPIAKLRGGRDLDWNPERIPSRLWFCAGGMGQPPTYKEYGLRRANSRKEGQQRAKEGYYKDVLHWGLPPECRRGRIRGDNNRNNTGDSEGPDDGNGNGGDEDDKDEDNGGSEERGKHGILVGAHIHNIGLLNFNIYERDSNVRNYTTFGHEIFENIRPEAENGVIPGQNEDRLPVEAKESSSTSCTDEMGPDGYYRDI